MKKYALVIALAASLSAGIPANARGTGLWGGKTAGGGELGSPVSLGNSFGIAIVSLFWSEFRSFTLQLVSR